jgi:hypothetical protein
VPNLSVTSTTALPAIITRQPGPLPTWLDLSYTVSNNGAQAASAAMKLQTRFDDGGVGTPIDGSAFVIPAAGSIAMRDHFDLSGLPPFTTPFIVELYAAPSSAETDNGDRTLVLGTVQFAPGPPLVTITTAALVDATLGLPYSVQLEATSLLAGQNAWGWRAKGLPPGLSLSPSGLLSGTPTFRGTFSVDVGAALGQWDEQWQSLALQVI